MNPEVKKYLDDMLYSILLIENHIENISSLSDYENDQKTIDSVERRLAIIGEALFKVEKIENTIGITDRRKIIGLRHILVHDYDLIEDSTIWLIITKSLPVLKSELLRLIDE